MASADDDQEPLELLHLYADQDEATVWARRVAWANEGLTPDDVDEWVDTREGSFFHVTSIGGAREDARIYDLMGTETVAAAHPLFAWETYLDSHAETQALFRNAAVAATGIVTFTGAPGTVIGTGVEVGTEPTAPDAEAPEFETTVGGVIPGGGSIDLAVRATETSKGTIGNVSAGAIVGILTDVPGLVSVTNADPTVGGADTETDEGLRSRLLAVYGGGGGWNKAAFEVAALAYGNGIGQVTVIPLWDGPGTVKVVIATADGDPVSAGTVTGFQNFIDPIAAQGAGAAMVGIAVTVQTAAVQNVTVAASVEPEPGYSVEGDGGTIALRPVIEAQLAAYVDAIGSDDEVVLAKVAGAIANLRGVHDVTAVTINGAAANLAVPAPSVPSLVVPVTLTEV
jgi:uncharacterized phage protein gp47/JayE